MEEHDWSSIGPDVSDVNSRNPGAVGIDMPASHHFEQCSTQSLYSEYSQSSQTTQGSRDRRLRKSGAGGGAWNAPVAHFTMTETSGQTYGFGTKTEEDRYCRLAEEARRWMLGPMPPREFLDEFLNQDDEWACRGEMPTSEGAFDAVPKAARLEKSIYEPLARAMNQGRCPGFTFCITSEAADNSGPLGLTGSSKPDICCYACEHFDKVQNYEPKPKGRNNAGEQLLNSDMGGAGGSSDGAGGTDESESEGSSDAGTARETSPTPAATKSKSKPVSRLKPVPMKHTHMGYAALVVEVKTSPHHDVFYDPKPKDDHATFHFVTQSTDAKVIKRLGQQVSYATEICKRQHRHFCFTISICSHYARFIRWDRAGAIVSERFSVREQPELLCDFLWRFAWASHAQRGYDLTVEPAAPDQAKGFELAIRAHVRSQGGPTAQPKLENAVKEHFEQESVTVIHLPGSSSPGPQLEPDELAGHYLFVSRPIVIPLSVAGRGTRVYWAVDPLTNDVCLLKDTWRYDAPHDPDGSEKEGDVLHALCAVTENVPHVMRHGDVLRSMVVIMNDLSPEEADSLIIQHTDGDVQTTVTQNFLQHSWVCRAGRTPDQLKHFIIKRTHYRLVLGVAGYPLLRFKDSNELFRATYDAFGALMAAFEQGKRLHRDITPGNIILYNDPARCIERPAPRKGYLIDWELSRKCKPKNSKSFVSDESYPVSATWQFVSAAIAKYVRKDGAPRQRHTIGDDIESIIYVILYCALLWLPFEKPDPWAVKNVLEMFDYCTPWQDGVIRGGLLKGTNLEDQSFTGPLQWTVPTIQQWLSEALDWVARDARWTSTSKLRTVVKAFHAWWGEFLANCQGHNGPAKRSDNTKVEVLRHVFKSKKSAAVMEGVIHQSTISASGNSSNRTVSKRVRDGDSVPSSPGHAGSSKRPRLNRGNAGTIRRGGHLLPTAGSWRTPKESIDTIQAASSWNSSRASSELRELTETEGGVEGDLDHPDAYDSDPTFGAEEQLAAEGREDEDEVTGEIEVSVAKGKGRAGGVKGWGPEQ